jgi:hypothetical protein
MADHELTPEKGLRLFNEIFGSEDAVAPPTRTHRKYILEYLDGEPVFRLAAGQGRRPRDVRCYPDITLPYRLDARL